MPKIQTSIFGGLNLNDQGDLLLLRSHTATNGQWQQKAPSEATQMFNIDFDRRGIKKRAGSTITDDMSSLMGSGEEVIASLEYYAANGSRIVVRVTTLSIYTNQSGSFSKINNSSSSAYSHAATASKCTFAITDGHLFIGLDGANKIQVYRAGADLDDELDNGNTYRDSFGSGTHAIDGTWGNGYYLLASLQGRLVYSDGNTVVNYSTVPIATDGIWKRSAHGFYQVSGLILALETFVPDFSDSVRQTLYIFTSNGPELTYDLTSQIQQIENGPVPINHQSVIQTKSWLVLLTTDRKVIGINGNSIIDLGRRFSDHTGNSDIETFDIANSLTKAFGFYHREKEQVYFFTPDASLTSTSHCFVLDLSLGEPLRGEAQPNFEQRVRLAIWKINEPTTNAWFSSMYRRKEGVVGITKEGKAYSFLNGKNDLETILIDATYESMEFNGGVQAVNKHWITLSLRGQFIGDYTTTVKYLYDRSTLIESTTTYSQTAGELTYGSAVYGVAKYSDVVLIKGRDDIALYTESIKIYLNNAKVDQTFRFDTIDIEYEIGAEER
jgi:hypothetical protein